MLTKIENYPTLSLLELPPPLHNRSCSPPPLGQSAILQQIFHFMSKYIECKLCLFSGFAAAASTFKAVLAHSSPEKLDLRVQLKNHLLYVELNACDRQ